jgi:P4 family phage/plasmid primase-like protien
MRKSIESIRNHKFRVNLINDIICKITNNNVKFNEQRHLFAFNNKIFDIDKNDFVEPKPEQLINISTGYDYVENYDTTNIDNLNELLNNIFVHEQIKKLYLEILATGLEGQTLEKFILANGSGGNGKSLINEIALSMFGAYGYVLPSNVLQNNLKLGSNPEIANLNYKRFSIAREPDSNYTINTATIKEICGGCEINARKNHSNDTETHLQITLILECNKKPKLNEVTDAIYRRIIDIPFLSSFVDKQTYDKLDDKTNIFIKNDYFKSTEFKLKHRQALFEIIRHHKFNNVLPDVILRRNKEYLRASDELNEFIEEYTEKKDKECIMLKELFTIFKTTDFYKCLNKTEQRNYTYTSFVSNLETNIFCRNYVCTNKNNVKILKGFILKLDDN